MSKVLVTIGLACILSVSSGGVVRAEKPDVVIGVLNDQAGANADITGRGSVVAAQMAVDDFGGRVLGKPIRIVTADHQNKPDIGAGIAREWFEKDVDAIADVPTSSVALAVQEVARQKKRIFLITGASSTCARSRCRRDRHPCRYGRCGC